MTEHQTRPEPLVVTVESLARPDWAAENPSEYAGDDTGGFFYATGRMDQGHPAVVREADVTAYPTVSITAWHFGRKWAELQRQYRDPHGPGGYYPGIESAWDNYAATGGRNLRRPYIEEDPS